VAVRVKLDGFRALAFIESGSCRLVSRKAHVYKSFSGLCQSLGHLPYEAVLDGEIVCLDRNGCPQFDSLFYRPGEPNFYAFDVPYLDGRDLRGTPLVERKRILGESFRDRIRDCSTSAILRAAELICFGKSAPAFLEGVVAKWKDG
jgi:bifunctional non-homologous end joining protein LigD